MVQWLISSSNKCSFFYHRWDPQWITELTLPYTLVGPPVQNRPQSPQLHNPREPSIYMKLIFFWNKWLQSIDVFRAMFQRLVIFNKILDLSVFCKTFSTTFSRCFENSCLSSNFLQQNSQIFSSENSCFVISKNIRFGS